MVQINFARKEINCKLVYYGPGLSGKTTSLEVVHQKTPDRNKGELTSISTDGDRTLFFDFMPLDLGTIAGMKTKFHLYTVPGQVYYNSTRKLVLLGADGVIFVADSTPGRMDDNVQSLENLRENLAEMGRDLNKIPLVIQYNKRDIPGATSVEELNAKLNPNGVPHFEASAKTGEGIFQTLKAISALVLEDINSNEKKISASSAGRRITRPGSPAGGGADSSSMAAGSEVRTAGQAGGLMPHRDKKQVLRPAAARQQRGGPATAVAQPRQAASAQTQAPVTPLPRGSDRRGAAVARSKAALARQIDSAQRAASPVGVRRTGRSGAGRRNRRSGNVAAESSSGNGKMMAFMVLGILTGAVAAILAFKFLMQ